MLENGELARHFGAANHSGHRLLRSAQRLVESFEFLLHRTTRVSRQDARQTFGRGVRTVRGRKSIVHIEISAGCDRCREFRIVLFFTLPETGVFKQPDVTCTQNTDRLLRHIARDFGDKHHFSTEHILHRALHQAKRHSGIAIPLGTAEMRQQQYLGTAICQFKNGRSRRLDPGHIGNMAFLHRQVEVHAYKRDLASHVAEIIEGLEGCHIGSCPGGRGHI